jgi:hypothetical protein
VGVSYIAKLFINEIIIQVFEVFAALIALLGCDTM